MPEAKGNLEKLKQRFPDKTVIGLSTVTGQGVKELKEELWKMSGLLRIYTKDKKEPMIFENQSSVKELVEKIHKDLVKKFKFARVTGKSAKFPNQQVGLSHVLEDEDVIEVVSER